MELLCQYCIGNKDFTYYHFAVMLLEINLTPLSLFDLLSDPSILCQQRKTWMKSFQMYVAAMTANEHYK